MSRSLLSATMLAAILACPVTVQATELISSTETISDLSEVFAFDFTADPDLAAVEVTDTLLGVRVDWLFQPGSGSTTLDLRAKLTLAGEDSGVGFDTQIDPGLSSISAFGENNSTSLTIGDEVLAELLGSPSGKIEGFLRVLGTNIPELVTYFDNGGSLQATLTLITDSDGGPGGGGNPVPEPTSLLVWSVVGLGGVWTARRRAKSV